MPGFRELLAQTKKDIREIEPADAEARLADATFLDVRELDEYEQGMIPGAVFIPRGHLESQIENKVSDRAAPVVIYCAGGTRSAFAAKTLQELGYSDVVSMRGGFGRWKNEGRPWITPAVLDPDQRNRYQRHILLPEVGEAGQQKLLESKVLLLGAGGLGSPAALYLAAAGVGTLGIVDMDVVDASNLQRQILHNMERIGERKVDSAKKTLTALNPDVNVVTYDVRFGADNILDILDDYDVVLDGTDNFPTRYLLNDASLLEAHPRRARIDLPVRRSGHGVRSVQRAVLPLPAARAAAAGARTVVRGGRRARRAARHHRFAPGARSDQAAARPRASRCAAGCSRTTRWRRASGRSRCGAIRSARRAARTHRSSSPSTTSSACLTRCSPTAD